MLCLGKVNISYIIIHLNYWILIFFYSNSENAIISDINLPEEVVVIPGCF